MKAKFIKTILTFIIFFISISFLYNEKLKINNLYNINLEIYKGKLVEEFLSNIDTNYFAFIFIDNNIRLIGCDFFYPMNDSNYMSVRIIIKNYQFLDPKLNRFHFWDIDSFKKEKIDTIIVQSPYKSDRRIELNYMKVYYENKDRIIKELKMDSLNQKKK